MAKLYYDYLLENIKKLYGTYRQHECDKLANYVHLNRDNLREYHDYKFGSMAAIISIPRAFVYIYRRHCLTNDRIYFP